ncbi:MAG: hypothetical protein F6K19_34810 [Cyanothece sp. SIO1E1]|nr:hypothetical protein [Cyanothece sp. SIO1E1]
MTNLSVRLYEAWRKAVLEEKIVNLFEATQDDLAGRWVKGDRIVYGIRIIDGELAYYAQNLSQSRDIQGATAEKQVGNTGYLCRLNSYRALRPGVRRRPIGRQPDIPADPERCRFHCQNIAHPLSLLRREPLLQFECSHFTWNAYYNVAPLDKEGHFLWVPTPSASTATMLPHIPQQLSLEFLQDAVELFGQLTQTILFFNALHAGASVNHIHWQALYHRHSLPIEAAPIVTDKGYHRLDNYPVQAMVFTPRTPVGEIFTCVDRLQEAGIPFNLAMLRERILLVVRNIEHEIVSEFPNDGFAALGLCGTINTVDPRVYETINDTMIEAAFEKIVIPAQQVIDIWLTP